MANSPDFRKDIEEALQRGGADRLPARSDRARRAPSASRGFRFDPRPSSPAQVALVGLIVVVVAYFRLLGPYSSLAFNVGLGLLLLAGITWFIRPRRRTVVWRERRIDLDAELSLLERLYYLIYRG